MLKEGKIYKDITSGIKYTIKDNLLMRLHNNSWIESGYVYNNAIRNLVECKQCADDEKELLRLIIKYNPEFANGWIAKDKCGDIGIYKFKPKKGERYWCYDNSFDGDEIDVPDIFMGAFEQLSFDDPEPAKISDILE